MKTKLDLFFENLDLTLLESTNGWRIERSGEVIFFELPAKDQQFFRVRIECDGYSEKIPSVMFVDAEGSRLNPTAWPKGDSTFMGIVKPPPNCFLCTELTREGIQHHGEWRNLKSAWSADRHSLSDIFNLLHRLLNSDGYMGRGVTP